MIAMAATLSSGFIVLENTRAIAGDNNSEQRIDANLSRQGRRKLAQRPDDAAFRQHLPQPISYDPALLQ